jgi:hypothetical protein
MVLLISASRNSADCLAAIQKELGESAEHITSISQVAAKLRSAEYSAIVVDQSLIDADPASHETVWKHAGTAIPVFLNFAISGVERVIRDLRAALARRQKEQLAAARAAQAALRNELTGAVAGILLSSELALAQPAIPAALADKLRSVHELALELKERLGTVA